MKKTDARFTEIVDKISLKHFKILDKLAKYRLRCSSHMQPFRILSGWRDRLSLKKKSGSFFKDEFSMTIYQCIKIKHICS